MRRLPAMDVNNCSCNSVAGRTAPAGAHQISKIYYTLLPSVINVSRDMKEVFHKNIGNKKM